MGVDGGGGEAAVGVEGGDESEGYEVVEVSFVALEGCGGLAGGEVLKNVRFTVL